MKANEDEYVLIGINLPEVWFILSWTKGRNYKMHLLFFVLYSVVIAVFKCPK